jgi:hypothetical protein
MRSLTTLAPLPKWVNLFRIFLPVEINDIVKYWHFENELAGRLSRSAWSLALIAIWRKKSMPESLLKIWVPEFFCNASLLPLRELGVELVFYPLNDKMQPDIAGCSTLAIHTHPDIFILVHYFGQPTDHSFAVKLCLDSGAWLVEDAAHALKPVNSIGKSGDFVLYSPHKHLPIPDGSILVVRSTGPSQLKIDEASNYANPSSWQIQIKEILVKKNSFIAETDHFMSLIWLTKRILQKWGIRSQVKQTQFKEEIMSKSKAVISKLEPPSQSIIGKRLLAVLCSELDNIAYQRKKNQKLWDNFFVTNNLIDSRFLVAERPKNEIWTPYLISFKADMEYVEKIYNSLQRMGLPVLTWPDLPPEIIKENLSESSAYILRHSRIYLPIHQSINFSKILQLNMKDN